MRELDELRIEIVGAVESGEEDFITLKKCFIKKQNSLKRNGHTRWKEGYKLSDIINQKEEKEKKDEKV